MASASPGSGGLLAGSVNWGEVAHVPTQRPSSSPAPAPIRTTRTRARRPAGRGRGMALIILLLPSMPARRRAGRDLDVAVGPCQERRPVRAGGVAPLVLAEGELAVDQRRLRRGVYRRPQVLLA